MGKIIEGISDVLLFVLITLPVGIGLLTAPFCYGWNEGSSASGSCSIPALEGLYKSVMTIGTAVSFGAIFFVPIVFLALIVSGVIKFKKYNQGYHWNTFGRILVLAPFAVTVLAIIFLIGFIFLGVLLIPES